MRNYFEGWYLKHQSETDSLALIPSCHYDAAGKSTGSLQVITSDWSRQVSFPTFRYRREEGTFVLGNSWFSQRGCVLNLDTPELSLSGVLRYGPLTRLTGDVMGPFRFVPFLQCRHSVFSLSHSVTGTVTVNGTRMDFDRAVGYMEGDRGHSFPRRYLWTQCSWERDCVMLSVAEVPLLGRRITGCIGLVWLEGTLHRLTTYLGAKVTQVGEQSAEIRQGRLRLKVTALDCRSQPLSAPQRGAMARTIHESLTCTVRYQLWQDEKPLLDVTSDRASFEGMWL